jgi:hypothetical protein
MSTLMPPPSKPVVRQAAPVAQQPDVHAIVQAVDRTVHATTLLLRTAAYATATAMISGASFGPSFLFGALLGDLLGCVAQVPSTLRRAPIASWWLSIVACTSGRSSNSLISSLPRRACHSL